jgi:hypothetical protein
MSRGGKVILSAMPPLGRECIQCKKTLNAVKARAYVRFSFTGIKLGDPSHPTAVSVPVVLLHFGKYNQWHYTYHT